MKKTFLFLILLALATIISVAQESSEQQIISIIPKPATLQIKDGKFNFNENTTIRLNSSSTELKMLGDLIAESVNQKTGWKLRSSTKTKHENSKSLILLQIKKNHQPNESYSLEIGPNKIIITAGSGAGVFYGIQSLLQLMPVNIENTNLSVPCATIEDSPRFTWRGVHLDVCRHMFPIGFIKKYIDILAMYKMNTFHWHLTDDQGWRIEIKKYPKLAQIGAWRKETMGDGKPYGGFYTQKQIREVVAYAKTKYITVVPEIEMPGHALAALSAYPELSCTGRLFEVGTTWGVFDDIYCAGNEKVFTFLENVLTEVIKLFHGEYVHIGGDEAPKSRWEKCPKCQARMKAVGLKTEMELQSYFIQRIEKFLNSKGKKIIGWDEILEGGLAQNAAVMSWRGNQGGIAAAKSKHVAVMTPTDFCYFDYYQAKDVTKEPKAIGGYLPIEKVYSYEPIPDSLRPNEAKYIIGTQANMWSEYLTSTEYVEYMLLPRLCALSEVAWTQKELKNYDDFSKRLIEHYAILSSKKINFKHSN
jgi:hexosaminidase